MTFDRGSGTEPENIRSLKRTKYKSHEAPAPVVFMIQRQATSHTYLEPQNRCRQTA